MFTDNVVDCILWLYQFIRDASIFRFDDISVAHLPDAQLFLV